MALSQIAAKTETDKQPVDVDDIEVLHKTKDCPEFQVVRLTRQLLKALKEYRGGKWNCLVTEDTGQILFWTDGKENFINNPRG